MVETVVGPVEELVPDAQVELFDAGGANALFVAMNEMLYRAGFPPRNRDTNPNSAYYPHNGCTESHLHMKVSGGDDGYWIRLNIRKQGRDEQHVFGAATSEQELEGLLRRSFMSL